MKRKMISIALVAAMAVSAVTGCGTTPTPSGGGTGDGVQVTADGLKKYDDVKLKLLHCWNGGKKTPPDQYGNLVATAIRDKIGVTVEYEGVMMSETEKLNLIFASGDMPDIIDAPYWGGNAGETEVIKKAGAEGRLLALDDYIGNYPNIKNAWDVGIVSQSYLDNDLEPPEFGGNHYILPRETSGEEASINNWTYGVFARGDIIESLGVDPQSIHDQNDLYDLAVKIRDGKFKDINGNDIIPISTFQTGWDYSRLVTSFSYHGLTQYKKLDDGSYTYRMLTDDWVNEQMFIRKLVQESIMDKECFKQSGSQAEEKIGNGTVGMFACQYGPGILATKKTGLYINQPEMRYVPIGPMNYVTGEPYTQLEAEGRSGSPAMVFPTTCKNIEAALAWVDYINSKEGQTLVRYGFEGEDYVMKDGFARLTDEQLQLKRDGDPDFEDKRLERGIGIYHSVTLANKSMSWFGEMDPGDADAAVEESEAYKKMAPVEVIKGYPVDKLGTTFPEYEQVSKIAFEGSKQGDTKEKSYFADSDEAALQILHEYQDYLRTSNDGLFMKFLKYLEEQAATRDDVVC